MEMGDTCLQPDPPCSNDDAIVCECQKPAESKKELRIIIPTIEIFVEPKVETWATFIRRLFALTSLRGSTPLACTTRAAVPVSTA